MKAIFRQATKVLNAMQMNNIDERASSIYGIPSICLMENASRAVADVVVDILEDINFKRIIIIAGHGNNGGDGFAVARHLHNLGAIISVVFVGDESKMSKDTKTNYLINRKMQLDVMKVSELESLEDVLADAELIVDALLGTGVKGELKEAYLEIIDAVNLSNVSVISVDIPSGVNADTGQINSTAIQADYTVTFALPKIGLLTYPGVEYTGELVIADIGIPFEELSDNESKTYVMDSDAVRLCLPIREPESHKGTFGHLGVVAGSIGMTGAAALVCEGALRIGTGLVSSIIPAGLNQIMEVKLTEAMTLPIGSKDSDFFIKSDVDNILQNLNKKTAAVIGPGMGRNEDSIGLINNIIPKLECPAVIDADALYQISLNPDMLKKSKSELILTPHPGEMAMLCGISVDEVQKNRLETARSFAVKYGVTVVLKGAGTVIADKDGNAFINTTGCAGMASGGAGDVLAGIIGGLVAQGKSAMESAVYGVYIHGLAGELAEEVIGSEAMLASDVVRMMPNTIKAIKGDIHEGGCSCGG